MSKIVFTNTVKRFLRDKNARLAAVPVEQNRRRSRDIFEREEQKSDAAALLFTGLTAAVYVALRIGLTYAAIGHTGSH